jgi:hypothetical protein
MPISEHASGTQAATVGTEHTLNTTSPDTTDGAYQLVVDLSAMALGDKVELRIKEKALSAGTQRQAVVFTFANAQTDALFISPAVLLLHGWDMTLKQTAGTGRSFPWSIRKVA